VKKEIERKFLVVSDDWRHAATKKSRIKQGYLVFGPPLTVRVRLRDDEGFLTIKDKSNDGGLSRNEWEKKLEKKEAERLFEWVKGQIVEKIRYEIPWQGYLIEVDEFLSPRKGLVLAEIELNHPDDEVKLPPWLGEEVTGKPEYYNSYMAKNG